MFIAARERELAEIARLVERAGQGHGGLLVVAGRPGRAKPAVADAAAAAARAEGITVVRVSPDSMEAQLSDGTGTETGRQLVLVDDADHGGDSAVVALGTLASRAAGTTTAIVATTTTSLGLGPECVLPPLTEPQLAVVLGADLDVETVGAIHLAARGLPGPALVL